MYKRNSVNLYYKAGVEKDKEAERKSECCRQAYSIYCKGDDVRDVNTQVDANIISLLDEESKSLSASEMVIRLCDPLSTVRNNESKANNLRPLKPRDSSIRTSVSSTNNEQSFRVSRMSSENSHICKSTVSSSSSMINCEGSSNCNSAIYNILESHTVSCKEDRNGRAVHSEVVLSDCDVMESADVDCGLCMKAEDCSGLQKETQDGICYSDSLQVRPKPFNSFYGVNKCKFSGTGDMMDESTDRLYSCNVEKEDERFDDSIYLNDSHKIDKRDCENKCRSITVVNNVELANKCRTDIAGVNGAESSSLLNLNKNRKIIHSVIKISRVSDITRDLSVNSTNCNENLVVNYANSDDCGINSRNCREYSAGDLIRSNSVLTMFNSEQIKSKASPASDITHESNSSSCVVSNQIVMGVPHGAILDPSSVCEFSGPKPSDFINSEVDFEGNDGAVKSKLDKMDTLEDDIYNDEIYEPCSEVEVADIESVDPNVVCVEIICADETSGCQAIPALQQDYSWNTNSVKPTIIPLNVAQSIHSVQVDNIRTVSLVVKPTALNTPEVISSGQLDNLKVSLVKPGIAELNSAKIMPPMQCDDIRYISLIKPANKALNISEAICTRQLENIKNISTVKPTPTTLNEVVPTQQPKRKLSVNSALPISKSSKLKVNLKSSVRRRVWDHSSRPFKCDFPGCVKGFNRKSCLEQHQKAGHRAFSRPVVHSCTVCGAVFTNQYNLKRHLKSIHSRIETGGRRLMKFVCSECGDSQHSECGDSKQMFASRKAILQHYEESHAHVVMEESQSFHFNSLKDFSVWKDTLQSNTYSSFVLESGGRVTTEKDQTKIQHYLCHRSGFARLKRDRVRTLKKCGSNKMGFYCPARIVLTTLKDGSLEAVYSPTHLGHSLEPERLTLSKAERDVIAGYLMQGVPMSRVLDRTKASASTRLSMIGRKDLHNIAASYKIKENLSSILGISGQKIQCLENGNSGVVNFAMGNSSVVNFGIKNFTVGNSIMMDSTEMNGTEASSQDLGKDKKLSVHNFTMLENCIYINKSKVNTLPNVLEVFGTDSMTNNQNECGNDNIQSSNSECELVFNSLGNVKSSQTFRDLNSVSNSNLPSVLYGTECRDIISNSDISGVVSMESVKRISNFDSECSVQSNVDFRTSINKVESTTRNSDSVLISKGVLNICNSNSASMIASSSSFTVPPLPVFSIPASISFLSFSSTPSRDSSYSTCSSSKSTTSLPSWQELSQSKPTQHIVSHILNSTKRFNESAQLKNCSDDSTDKSCTSSTKQTHLPVVVMESVPSSAANTYSEILSYNIQTNIFPHSSMAPVVYIPATELSTGMTQPIIYTPAAEISTGMTQNPIPQAEVIANSPYPINFSQLNEIPLVYLPETNQMNQSESVLYNKGNCLERVVNIPQIRNFVTTNRALPQIEASALDSNDKFALRSLLEDTKDSLVGLLPDLERCSSIDDVMQVRSKINEIKDLICYVKRR